MKAETGTFVGRTELLLRVAPLLAGATVVAGGLIAISLGIAVASQALLATGIILLSMGTLVSLLAARRFRNRIVIEVVGTFLSLVVVTILFTGFGASTSRLGSLGGVLMVLVYLVLGLVLADRILLVRRKGPFSSTPAGFCPPVVPLRRFFRRGRMVHYDEVARFLVRYESESKRVGYAILRDGTLLMLREVEGVPSEFINQLATLAGTQD